MIGACRLFVVALGLVATLVVTALTSPVADCPQGSGSYFVSDSSNACIYYWCLDGNFLAPGSYSCAPGSGTRLGFHGYDNPCTEHVTNCYPEEGSNPTSPTQTQTGYYGNSNNPAWKSGSGYQQSGNGGGYSMSPRQQPTGNSGSDGYGNGRTHTLEISIGYSGSGNGGSKGYGNGRSQTQNRDGFGNGGSKNYGYGGGSQQRTSTRQPISGRESNDGYYVTKRTTTSPKVVGTPPLANSRFLHIPADMTASYLYITNPRVVLALPGVHVAGAIRQSGLSGDITSCLTSCLATEDCRGIEFDRSDVSCWFHSQTTVCNTPKRKAGYIHIQLTLCDRPIQPVTMATTPSSSSLSPASGSGNGRKTKKSGPRGKESGNGGSQGSTTTTTSATTTASEPTDSNPSIDEDTGKIQEYYVIPAVYPGSGVYGGQLQAGIDDLVGCLSSCAADDTCQGVDFHNDTGYCYFFTASDECQQLVNVTSATHYRLTSCSPDDNLSVVYADTHAVGGALQSNVTSADDCLRTCQGQGRGCVAADYDRSSDTCWLHSNVTCSLLEDRPHTLHMRTQPC